MSQLDFPILSVMLAVPMAAAIACLFLKDQRARWLALAATLLGEQVSPAMLGVTVAVIACVAGARKFAR